MPQGQKPRCSPRRAALPRHVCDPSAGCMVFLSGRCGWTREILKIGKRQGGECTSYVTCTRLRYIVSSSVPSSHCVLHFVMFWYVVVCTDLAVCTFICELIFMVRMDNTCWMCQRKVDPFQFQSEDEEEAQEQERHLLLLLLRLCTPSYNHNYNFNSSTTLVLSMDGRDLCTPQQTNMDPPKTAKVTCLPSPTWGGHCELRFEFKWSQEWII